MDYFAQGHGAISSKQQAKKATEKAKSNAGDFFLSQSDMKKCGSAAGSRTHEILR